MEAAIAKDKADAYSSFSKSYYTTLMLKDLPGTTQLTAAQWKALLWLTMKPGLDAARIALVKHPAVQVRGSDGWLAQLQADSLLGQ